MIVPIKIVGTGDAIYDGQAIYQLNGSFAILPAGQNVVWSYVYRESLGSPKYSGSSPNYCEGVIQNTVQAGSFNCPTFGPDMA